MIKVMSVFGTRPEAIKMAPLVKTLEQYDDIESIVCVTGQHRQMLDQVLEIFDIKPDYDLDIMKDQQTLVTITSRVLKRLDEVLHEVQPDVVLVHGDTTTSMAAALADFYNQIKVGHVEAGLRTFDKYSPFPEEMNRCITGRIADFNFAPTETNRKNLMRETTPEESIFVTGNTVIDALKITVKEDYEFHDETMRNLDWNGKRVILMTAHRRENLGEPMRNIFHAVKRVVENHPEVEVVYPVHLNPAVQEPAKEILGNLERVHLIPPVDVDDLHNAMHRSFFVMTDSGGLQEEAPSLGKPVLVLRHETERPEAVAAGTVKIAGIEEDQIVRMAEELLTDSAAYEKMSHAVNPYGDGNASHRIAQAILYEFGKSSCRPQDFKG